MYLAILCRNSSISTLGLLHKLSTKGMSAMLSLVMKSNLRIEVFYAKGYLAKSFNECSQWFSFLILYVNQGYRYEMMRPARGELNPKMGDERFKTIYRERQEVCEPTESCAIKRSGEHSV